VINGLLKLTAQATILVITIILLGIWPSWHYGGEAGLKTMVAAGGVCLTGTIISLVPMVIAIKKKAIWLAQACLGGTVLRLLMTLILAGVVYWAIKPSMIVFALWIMGFYLVLLTWETKTALKYIRAFYDNVKMENRASADGTKISGNQIEDITQE